MNGKAMTIVAAMMIAMQGWIIMEQQATRSEIADLRERVARLEVRMGSLETRMGSLETRMKSLEDRVFVLPQKNPPKH